LGLTIGDKLNIIVASGKLILMPLSFEPWKESDPFEACELIPSSLVKAAGLEGWEEEGFLYPSVMDSVDDEEENARKREILLSLRGSCVDPTMAEPPEVPFEYDLPNLLYEDWVQ